MMIRYTFVKYKVMELYSSMQSITFPISIKQVIDILPNCKYMSYQKFAKINHCSMNDVIRICESNSGCTHYDQAQNRYLILCNQSTDHNNNIGRQRWTCCHEIGHVVCKHHTASEHSQLSENNLLTIANSEYESEADYFAGMLLAPFPFFKLLHISSAADIGNTFGLSAEASSNRYKQYIRWCNTKVKSSWENDMAKIFRSKYQCR